MRRNQVTLFLDTWDERKDETSDHYSSMNFLKRFAPRETERFKKYS